MVFSSLIFLFCFFPIVFIGYRLIDRRFKNAFLLLASLIFYGWERPQYLLIMIVSILFNYAMGILMSKSSPKWSKLILAVSVLVNLSMLGYFKYYNFFVLNVNKVAGWALLDVKNIVLPIGISFYTFQALSYVIDLYRKQIEVQKNLLNFALYISFFPQLIAGPIVKYHDVEKQISCRTLTKEKTLFGIKRFIYGLTKKVLLANTFASVADTIYALPTNTVSTPCLWFAAILYTLQIYFDFSGYSDMAIGLGKMFGFDFIENFNYPYLCTSIQNFWQRWHISLSTWFKEYLYIPLGGNRKGFARTILNLAIVFLVTGIWHGANYNFILWGIYNGFFIILERLFFGKLLQKNRFKALNHIYSLFVVTIGWVIFRTTGLHNCARILKAMFIPQGGFHTIPEFVNPKLIILLVLGIVLCGVLQTVFPKIKERLFDQNKFSIVENVCLEFLLVINIFLLVNNTYNPFIYFQF